MPIIVVVHKSCPYVFLLFLICVIVRTNRQYAGRVLYFNRVVFVSALISQLVEYSVIRIFIVYERDIPTKKHIFVSGYK